ncbi:hypothetical protein BV20DRAFT_962676 [Pilatotrama ljubarskyi]|nr:hypothetical protein BV20DRAFT_962676 [Pilatotrama ljubarskyi]
MLARTALAKVCPCAGGRCLTASLSQAREVLSRELSNNRTYSTAANSTQSIFSPSVSAWDEVFEEIKQDVDPKTPLVNPRSLRMSAGVRAGRSPRLQAATARETQTINEMFSSIFESTTSKEHANGTLGIGRSRGASDMSHLYSKLRSHSQRLRWTTEADQELDRKKEEMELCETDMELLEWAMREVFGESKRYEQAARPTMDDAAKRDSPELSQTDTPQLQPSSYPHLLAALMRTFRDKYKDPHLALSMFDHARHLSIASYVFGCTTPAYNELIETRWRSFRDLRGVVEALEEMRVNGIELDSRTRLLGETIRREVGERDLWQEENSIGSGEVWELVARLERLVVAEKPRRSKKHDKDDGKPARRRKWSANQEAWKRRVLEESGKETFQFERWAPKKARQAFSLQSTPADQLKNALMQNQA